MKEIERIINSAILPESFFKEEVICDFKVDLARKKLWAISLDLLFKFDEVCRKHHIKYMLAYGSLLGIIRHHGFIPWDDDIDIFMVREEYEKLKSLKGEFSNPYFLQFPGDDGYLYSFAKLRNSNTTALSDAFRFETFNQGMPLDIFILDNFNPETVDNDLKKVRDLVFECSTLMRRSNPRPTEKDLRYMQHFPIVRKGAEVIQELDAVLTGNHGVSSDYYACLCNLIYDIKHGIFKKEDIDNLEDAEFYGHLVLIPKNYDSVLSVIYGDYMALPPVETRGTWHNQVLYDMDRPFIDYVHELWDKEQKNR